MRFTLIFVAMFAFLGTCVETAKGSVSLVVGFPQSMTLNPGESVTFNPFLIVTIPTIVTSGGGYFSSTNLNLGTLDYTFVTGAPLFLSEGPLQNSFVFNVPSGVWPSSQGYGLGELTFTAGQSPGTTTLFFGQDPSIPEMLFQGSVVPPSGLIASSTIEITVVPAPSTALGFLGLLALGRRSRR